MHFSCLPARPAGAMEHVINALRHLQRHQEPKDPAPEASRRVRACSRLLCRRRSPPPRHEGRGRCSQSRLLSQTLLLCLQLYPHSSAPMASFKGGPAICIKRQGPSAIQVGTSCWAVFARHGAARLLPQPHLVPLPLTRLLCAWLTNGSLRGSCRCLLLLVLRLSEVPTPWAHLFPQLLQAPCVKARFGSARFEWDRARDMCVFGSREHIWIIEEEKERGGKFGGCGAGYENRSSA